MLWALRDSSRISFWMSAGGQRHDLDELMRDEALQAWLRDRPALVQLSDETLVQHCGHDGYSRLVDKNYAEMITAINSPARDLLMHAGEAGLCAVLSPPNISHPHHARLSSAL